MEEYRLPKKAGFDVKYSKGKVLISTYYYIDRKISRYKYRYIEKNRERNPFTNVTFCYGNDQNEITVPTIVLVKSRGDVVLYDDFYKSNIDWKSLSEDKKRELYTEFVLHYLPKELGDAAVGNPITFIIMIIVGAVIAKAGAVIAACASLIGASFSVLNIIEGCKLISKSAEGYDSIYDVNATKVSAKDFARGIAMLGIEVIPVLLGLIKRGIAKYNNKEIKIDEFVKREFGKNSKIRPKTNKSKTIKIENDISTSLSGKWETVNENMSEFSRNYQKQVTGKEGVVWVQNGVKFDGMKDGTLLDAKGKYSQFIDKSTGEFCEWFSGKETLVSEARRQISASEGAKIQWYFAEEESLNAVQDLFIDRGITEIQLIFQAPK